MSKATVSLTDVERFIKQHPDEDTGDMFAVGSFAKSVYMNATTAHLRKCEPNDAPKAELTKWGLTADEWSAQMKAVARARAHDAKLDVVQRGAGRV